MQLLDMHLPVLEYPVQVYAKLPDQYADVLAAEEMRQDYVISALLVQLVDDKDSLF